MFEKFAEAKKRATLKVHNCLKPLPFPKNSVDHILCARFIELVYPSDADRILKEFYRVLKSGGTLECGVPGLAPMVRNYLASGLSDELLRSLLTHEAAPSLRYRVLELCGFTGLQTRWLYDSKSLTRRLSNVGFEVKRVEDGDYLLTYSIKP